MKLSIRTKFTLGMVFIFIIILVLLGFSAFYLNKLSNKTNHSGSIGFFCILSEQTIK